MESKAPLYSSTNVAHVDDHSIGRMYQVGGQSLGHGLRRYSDHALFQC